MAWAELHSVVNPTEEWYSKWLMSVPAFNCQCRDSWRRLTADMPPDFSSTKAFFEWSVRAHNLVNKELGKAEVSLVEAYATWRDEPL